MGNYRPRSITVHSSQGFSQTVYSGTIAVGKSNTAQTGSQHHHFTGLYVSTICKRYWQVVSYELDAVLGESVGYRIRNFSRIAIIMMRKSIQPVVAV